MKLRLGQPVHSTDGLFGEVGDIVIDPHEWTVTHLVVEPRHQHQQARLVPMSLIHVDGDDVHVDLDAFHIRQLQRVALREFLRFGEAADVGDGWDLGAEDVVALPFWNAGEFDLPMESGFIDLSYDRVPKGECEIRRQSEVLTVDDHLVGHVEGLLADEDHLVAVVVRSGLPGFRRNVVVPISKVTKVGNDLVTLSIGRSEFDRLPDAGRLEGPLGDSSVDAVGRRARSIVADGRHAVKALIGRMALRFDRTG